MRIQDIDGLYVGYNETEDFRVLIYADSLFFAERIADKYRIDSGLEGSFKVSELDDKGINDCFDCDHILTSENIRNKYPLTKENIEHAMICLEDNGIDSSETFTVLQALCYILCDAEIEEIVKPETFDIKINTEDEITVRPNMDLYTVFDFNGEAKKGIYINFSFYHENSWHPFVDITKCFGEYISIKNAAYIDLNNAPYAVRLLELGYATDTGLTKRNGLCTYPLWIFDETFLSKIGGAKYQQYSKEYDEYRRHVIK